MFFLSSLEFAFSKPGSFSYGLEDIKLCMEIKIDSSPWAEDHSSPRSPLHVLVDNQQMALTNVIFDITLESIW